VASDAAEVPVAQDAARIPPDQLDSLVAPLALFPDNILSQTLVASTYPLELMQLQQWLQKNGNLKDKALADAAAKQPWDPSIQAMAATPDLVKRLTNDIQWTTDLGNAFLAQQSDVMDAIQRMRQKAQGTGALHTTEQAKVETQVVEGKSVVVIEQSNPDVVYVPSYNPTVVYGEPAYPYPDVYYPPYYPGVVAASAISWGVGFAMGAWWGGGGWGWGAGWGRGDININGNNNFIRNSNINAGNRVGSGNRVNPLNGGNWQHNPGHRGGTPYPNRGVADRFGGTTRGDSLANRQGNARQQIKGQGGNLSSARGNAGGAGNRPSTGAIGGNRPGAGGAGNRPSTGAIGSNRPGAGGAGNRPGAGGAGNRPSTGVLGDRATSGGRTGVSDRSRGGSSGFGGGGGGDRVGSRSVGSSSGSRSAFGGGSGGFNGSSARASSSRGSSSMGGSRSFGGGGSRGGGGRSMGGGGGRSMGGGGRGGGGRGGGGRGGRR
jgi:hypothetical protein